MVKRNGRWQPASLQNYGSECKLQRLLAEAPELIPGGRGTATVRELSVPGSGQIDIVCVGEDGTLILVECKLAKNAEIRRAVVGQVFAYASALDGMAYDEFAQRFKARAGSPLVTAVEGVASGELDVAAFRTALTETLANGHFQLVLAVDEITEELKAIVEYLNRHLAESLTLVALELGYLPVADEEYLIPATFGAEIAERPASGKRAHWTEADIVEAVDDIEDEAARTLVRELLAHAEQHAGNLKGGTGLSPSAGFYYQVETKQPSVWSLYVKDAGPVVSVNLGSISRASEEVAANVLDRLRSSAPLAAKLDGFEGDPLQKYPEFVISDVLSADAGASAALRAALDAAVSSG